MKIAFLVNDFEGEKASYTTTLLADEARHRGHAVYYLTVEDFVYEAGDDLVVNAHVAPRDSADRDAFLEALQSPDCPTERLKVAELDALWLRADPAQEAERRPWAQAAAVALGKEAARRGVVVLNDPSGLSEALNKFYFQRLPAAIRPKTVISRSADDIKAFIQAHPGRVVLKPLQGSGGQSVFLVRPDEDANLNQMIEAVGAHGYIVAQECLPAVDRGDVRLFLMDGVPLRRGDAYAAFRRVSADDDLRSNMHAGGQAVRADVDADALRIVELVRDQVLRDGLFLVGLDIMGDKLLEINVFSPGGLHSAQETQETRFTDLILEAVEEKLAHRRRDHLERRSRELAEA